VPMRESEAPIVKCYANWFKETVNM
jgi:hypothetical protein